MSAATATSAPGTPRSSGRSRRRAGAGRVIARRCGFYLATAWVAITLNFLIPRVMPGDPASVIITQLAQRQPMTPETERAIRALFGQPDGNLMAQYVAYLRELGDGNLGLSTTYYPQPVLEVIATGLPWTIVLVGVTTVVAFLLGTGLGILSGMRPGGLADSIMAPLATLLGSMPYFWVGLLALLAFSVTYPWFPSQNGADLSLDPAFSPAFIASAIYHAVLPATTIVICSIGGWFLGMRNMMITTIAEDYVQLAEAKGLSRWRVTVNYAARNAMLPQVAGLAISLGSVVGGSLLAEAVFAYPGVGYLFYQAVVSLDYPLMQALFLAISLSVLAANFVADSVYVLLDPRTREN